MADVREAKGAGNIANRSKSPKADKAVRLAGRYSGETYVQRTDLVNPATTTLTHQPATFTGAGIGGD